MIVRSCPSSRAQADIAWSGLTVQHQQAFDLSQDLLVAEACSADCTCRAGCHTGAASLAERRIDLRYHAVFVEENGIEWAQVVADPAAGALVLVDAGADRLQGRSRLVGFVPARGLLQLRLERRAGDILGSLNATGDEDAFSHCCHRVQLGMSFDHPAIRAAGDAEHLATSLCVVRVVPALQKG